jgi:hypothetical protein
MNVEFGLGAKAVSPGKEWEGHAATALASGATDIVPLGVSRTYGEV